MQVTPGEALTIVVGSGGSKGIHGVTATPVNEVLRRPEIKQKTGKSLGGTPGGGVGYASNSTFAAGGGGGYTAVYRKDLGGTETVLIAGTLAVPLRRTSHLPYLSVALVHGADVQDPPRPLPTTMCVVCVLHVCCVCVSAQVVVVEGVPVTVDLVASRTSSAATETRPMNPTGAVLTTRCRTRRTTR